MGLGILTKGPVGLIVPAGAYAAARFAAGEGRPAQIPLDLGPAAFALSATWLGLVWWTGAPEGYLRELLIGQNLERAAGELGHRQPFYYHLPSAAADLLPWTLVPPAAALALSDPAHRPLLRRLAGWFGFVWFFFSLLASKRNITFSAPFPPRQSLSGPPGPTWTRLTFLRRASRTPPSESSFFAAGASLLAAGFWPGLPIAPWTLRIPGLIALLGGIALLPEAPGFHRASFYRRAALVAGGAVGLFVYPPSTPEDTRGPRRGRAGTPSRPTGPCCSTP